MGAASHYLESAGIPTTGISLVREHTVQMQLPRFLWVPFALGRPFGAPNEPKFQKRVLQTALELLERSDGPVVLEDFPDDAPRTSTASENDVPWSCPITFVPPQEEQPELVSATLDEMTRLEPWYEIHIQASGQNTPPVSGLAQREIVARLGDLAEGVREPEVETDLALAEWIRLGCDDLRNWYLDASQGQPGRATSSELRHWFWLQTAAARLIASASRALVHHPDPLVKMLALRAMVPREYLPDLAPEIGEHSWRER